jgi:hypothetical protein
LWARNCSGTHAHRQERLKIQLSASAHLAVVLAIYVGLTVLVAAAAGQNDCSGNVGDYEYDLTQLAQRIGGMDLQTTDPAGNTYYDRVCGVVSETFCPTVDDFTPAVCQKDARVPRLWRSEHCLVRPTPWGQRVRLLHSPLHRWHRGTCDKYLLPMVRHHPLLHPLLFHSSGWWGMS